MESTKDMTSDSKDIPILSTENLEEAKEFIDKQKSEDAKWRIAGTHSGVFHCDEVLGCALLKYTTEYSNPAIVRSRNPEIHKLVDILLDVGDVFDPESKRFDHHQGSFDQIFSDTSTENSKEKQNGEDHVIIKMSSAGLIYKYFGKEIIKNLASKWGSDLGSTEEEISETIIKIHAELYDDFIKEIDAIDNGVTAYK